MMSQEVDIKPDLGAVLFGQRSLQTVDSLSTLVPFYFMNPPLPLAPTLAIKAKSKVSVSWLIYKKSHTAFGIQSSSIPPQGKPFSTCPNVCRASLLTDLL